MPEVFQTSKEWSTVQKNNLRSRAHINVHVVVNFLSQLIFIFPLFWSMVM